LEVFLVHPGGPFWAYKDEHAWSVAKGEIEPDEDLLHAAYREFSEETGLSLAGRAVPLAPIRQASGKLVHVWAIEADIDPSVIQSNSFPLEWPPRSGQFRVYLRAYAGVAQARASIGPYPSFYNGKRPHSSLGRKTPEQAYINLATTVGSRCPLLWPIPAAA